jgi:hypothetical protein
MFSKCTAGLAPGQETGAVCGEKPAFGPFQGHRLPFPLALSVSYTGATIERWQRGRCRALDQQPYFV